MDDNNEQTPTLGRALENVRRLAGFDLLEEVDHWLTRRVADELRERERTVLLSPGTTASIRCLQKTSDHITVQNYTSVVLHVEIRDDASHPYPIVKITDDPPE